MTKNKKLCDNFDLGSVRVLFTGAAPLGMETAMAIQEQYPSWYIRQGYGIQRSLPRAMSVTKKLNRSHRNLYSSVFYGL